MKNCCVFWKIAFKFDLRYVMIGGVATNLHGYQRTTEDIDIWIDDTLHNREALRQVFKKYGLGDMEALAQMQFLRMDIMTSVKGLEAPFAEYLEYASVANIYDIKVPFLHLNHLIEAKKATNRPKDQIDLIELEKIRQILNPPKS